MRQRALPLLTTVIVLASLAGMQAGYDNASTGFKAEQKKQMISYSEPLVPSLDALKFLSLGDRPAVADILWLQSIQYFGSGNPYGTYRALGPMLDSITQLDPKFEYPYELGLIVLPFMQQLPMATTLGERAQQQFPDNGLLTFYHAGNYMLYAKDYQKAGFYYDKASRQPGSPTAAKSLAATAYNKVRNNLNDRLIAKAYWLSVAEAAKNDNDRDRAVRWAAQMQQIYDLETAASTYKTKTGQFPADFQALIAAGLIPGTPLSPVGRILQLKSDGTVNFDQVAPES